MRISKVQGVYTFGTVTLLLVINIIYRLVQGDGLGLYEIIVPAGFMIVFLYYLTWGNKQEKNGIYQDEELGKKIKEKSSGISYYLLLVILFLVVFIDRIVSGSFNVLWLSVLGVAMILSPLVEFIIARKYQ